MQHLVVSVGVSFSGKCRLHFVDEKAKVDRAHYVGRLLSNLVEDCTPLLPVLYKIGSRQTVRISLPKKSGLQIRQI